MRRRGCRIGCLALTTVAVVVLAGVVAPGAGARVSAIFYQCGSRARICVIAPTGGPRGEVEHAGVFAGVTGDGQTYGYYDAAGIWEAPVAGGAARELNVADGVGDPLMSGNGAAFLDESVAASGIQSVIEYRAAPGPSTAQMSLDTNIEGTQILGQLSAGWSGSTPLTSHWTAAATWICIGGQDGEYCGPNAATARTLATHTGVEDPDGSPDGSQIVAVSVAESSSSMSLVVFDARTGAVVRTLVAPRAGVGYATPRFSPNGTSVVFAAFAADDAQKSTIETVPVDGGPVHTIAPGSNPFWAPATTAPRPRVSLPAQTLIADSRSRRLVVSCHLAGAGTCAVTATITARAARALGLRASATKPYKLATGVRTAQHAGAMSLKLSLSHGIARALRRVRALSIRLTATSTAAGKLTQTTAAQSVLHARTADSS